jgi:Raf kinase inhibitor-like YbhB/YbcL family protein
MDKLILRLAAIACLTIASACGDDAGDKTGTKTTTAGRGGSGGKSNSAGAAAGGGTTGAAAGSGSDQPSTLALTSTVVADEGMLPGDYRCKGSVGGPTGPNPPLAWTGAPDGTLSFAIILRDRTFMNYQHWTIYDIPASETSLPEAVPTGPAPATPAGAKQAANSAALTGPGYYGPCGQSGMNHYEFKLYALDVASLPMPGTTGTSVEAVLEMHALATASLHVTSGP